MGGEEAVDHLTRDANLEIEEAGDVGRPRTRCPSTLQLLTGGRLNPEP